MLPEGHKQDIIQSGINFMRSITEAYGTEEGMKLWDNITSTLDPDVKGEIFFALLTGEYNTVISIGSYALGSNKISMIKAIRSVSGLGLKEAKELCDSLATGTLVKITCDPKKRQKNLQELRSAGFYV